MRILHTLPIGAQHAIVESLTPQERARYQRRCTAGSHERGAPIRRPSRAAPAHARTLTQPPAAGRTRNRRTASTAADRSERHVTDLPIQSADVAGRTS